MPIATQLGHAFPQPLAGYRVVRSTHFQIAALLLVCFIDSIVHMLALNPF